MSTHFFKGGEIGRIYFGNGRDKPLRTSPTVSARRQSRSKLSAEYLQQIRSLVLQTYLSLCGHTERTYTQPGPDDDTFGHYQDMNAWLDDFMQVVEYNNVSPTHQDLLICCMNAGYTHYKLQVTELS